ncbi:four helix bundle protein [Cesiribacter sp. SM1]|uniref:four helix bundle protein n=1 Tax=Cesiribacter sp. SM1 TaxID=2861196 RepID=UPI001CD19DA5|nr:four helix bundle protein [Cesiribacter sp. SM1]
MHNYKNLQVWQLAMEQAEKIYLLSANFPAEEKFGLVSQIRRSAVSIVSNIAEGSGRGSDKDFVRFLNMALGSAFEVETQLLLAVRLGYSSANDTSIVDKTNQLQKMIHNLIKKLE